ncbi:MAG TPA: DUF4349 domain-containing protein [Euzebya sp.]|nr:DUF4349 domain-containing protein [Euzebya sp.]
MMRTTTHPRRGHRSLLAVTVLLMLLLAACSSGSQDTDDSAVSAEAPEEARQDGATSGNDSADFDLGGDAEAEAPAADVAQGEAGEAEQPQDDSEGTAAAPQLPVDTSGTAVTGERIIKEGTVTLQVQPGEFDEAFRQVIVRAQELGGHVAGSSSSTHPVPAVEDGEDDGVLVTGQVTIRIPVRNFEDLLTVVGEAGEIVDRNVTSQDVTAEFTDLESRRRHLQAQERFYLGLLEEAATVQDAIAVQQQLDGIQGQIEQITGRLTLLEDRTSFSTLTVQIREQGADPVQPLEEIEPGGLTPYLTDAADVFIATVGSIIVVVTFIIPFLALLLLGYALWRMIRSSPRQTPSGPPAALPAPPAAGPVTQEQAREPVGVGGRGPEGPTQP